jgi:hypothetical protein
MTEPKKLVTKDLVVGGKALHEIVLDFFRIGPPLSYPLC